METDGEALSLHVANIIAQQLGVEDVASARRACSGWNDVWRRQLRGYCLNVTATSREAFMAQVADVAHRLQELKSLELRMPRYSTWMASQVDVHFTLDDIARESGPSSGAQGADEGEQQGSTDQALVAESPQSGRSSRDGAQPPWWSLQTVKVWSTDTASIPW